MDKQPPKETLTGWLGQKDSANLPDGNSDESGNRAFLRKRLSTKSPVRENCTPGSVRGLSGNWQSYRDQLDPETNDGDAQLLQQLRESG